MTTLYMPVASLGEDIDYFPVSDNGEGLQFFSRKPDAAKAAEIYVQEFGGNYYILEFRAYKTKSAVAQPRRSATNYSWQRLTNAIRPPMGRKVHITAMNTATGEAVEDIAWRISRNMWNWRQAGKIVSVPSSIEIQHWRLPHERDL